MSKLETLLDESQARQQRHERFDSFVYQLATLVTFVPGEASYASFEKTREILECYRSHAARQSNPLKWTTVDREVLDARLRCLQEKLSDVDVWVVLYQHYLFVGALHLRLQVALENLGGFFELGEETVLLTDERCENSLTLDWSEDYDISGGIEYLLSLEGCAWPKLARGCFLD